MPFLSVYDVCLTSIIALQCWVLTPEYPSGVKKSITVVQFNSWYRFTDVLFSVGEAVRYYMDPTRMVMSLSLETLLHTFRFFSVRDLRVLCRSHGVSCERSTKLQMMAGLENHSCQPRCGNSLLYVFQCLPKERRYTMSRLGHFLSTDYTSQSQPLLVSEPSSVGHSGPCTVGRSQESPQEEEEEIGEVGFKTEHLEPVSRDRMSRIIREWQNNINPNVLRHLVCASCSRKVLAYDSEYVGGESVDLCLLRNDMLSSMVSPTHYDFFLYKRAFLNVKGLEDPHCIRRVRLCKKCLNSLRNKKMPKFALANHLYYGYNRLPDDVKRAFDDASLFDRMLICRARCNSVCCRFNVGDGSGDKGPVDPSNVLKNSRKGVRGNVMVAPLNTIKMNKILPPASNVIKDTMCAVFVGRSLPSRASVHFFRPVLVRKSRVKIMISFLLSYNRHYSSDGEVSFSQSNLESLFGGTGDEGVPAVAEVGQIKVNDAIQGAISDYTPRNLDGAVGDDNELLMENVGYTDGDYSPMNYREMKSIALERCLMGKPFVASGVGGQPIPDFYHPSILAWLFPHLDPWGIGGFHHPDRKVRISMEEQLSHLMMIDDSPFERDTEFAFVFHNVVRKAAVSSSLRFRVLFKTHQRIARELLAVDVDILKAMSRECKRDPHFKPVDETQRRIFQLLASLAMVAKHIPGSDGYKIARRNEIRGLTLKEGTATLFLTINPADVDHPLVPLYVDGNLDYGFVGRSVELSEWRRKLLAAKNPAACALFFDKMITSFIRIILCYGREEPGIYGRCKAYYGMVEAQGKGTLHCHMLIWLEGHSSPQDTKIAMLSDEVYREKMFRWLEAAIACEFPTPDKSGTGLASQSMHLERKVSKDGELHPGTLWGPSISSLGDTDVFWNQYYEDVIRLLHHYNWHIHQATCWKYLSRGQARTDKMCRVGMDGETRECTVLDPNTAEILLRRHHPWIASYTGLVTFLLRCNMDIKVIGSGDAAKAFLYYVTDYITKPSLPVHAGLSALTYAIEKMKSRAVTVEGSDSMINAAIIAVNSMMGRQEISHPQVMSYLVGGGDHYTSAKFSALNWGAISKYCHQFYSQHIRDELEPALDDNLPVDLSLGKQSITASNQQLDYCYRSRLSEFEMMSLYDFVAWVEKAKFSKEGIDKAGACTFSDRRHPQYSTHYIWIRKDPRVPVLLGPSIPNPMRSAVAEESWAMAVLLLFVPWRDLTGLRDINESWVSAYRRQYHLISQKNRVILNNLNVLNDCKEARDVHSAELASARARASAETNDEGLESKNREMCERLAQSGWADAVDLNLNESVDDDSAAIEYDGTDLAGFNDENNRGRFAPFDDLLEEGFLSAFSACNPGGVGPPQELYEEIGVSRVVDEDGIEIARLSNVVESTKRKKVGDDETGGESNEPPEKRLRMDEHAPIAELAVLPRFSWWNGYDEYRDVVEDIIDEMRLGANPEQLRAFGIVARHVVTFQREQLLMYVAGVGGTGKSHLINALVLLFNKLGRRDELLLGAPTGIAAVLIGGNTLHSLVMATPNGASSDLAALGTIWKRVRYLIVDEISMVGAIFLDQFSCRIRQGKAAAGLPADLPFAGIHVIFTGDFGQLKPPGQYALYSSSLIRDPSYSESRDKKGISALNGVVLWRQVRTVVKLKKNQRHSGDEKYGAFLERLRVGRCSERICGVDDLTYIRSRIMKNVIGRGEDLTSFWDAPIIVGWRSLRDPLNQFMVDYHAARLGQAVYVYHSIDVVHGSRLVASLQNLL